MARDRGWIRLAWPPVGYMEQRDARGTKEVPGRNMYYMQGIYTTYEKVQKMSSDPEIRCTKEKRQYSMAKHLYTSHTPAYPLDLLNLLKGVSCIQSPNLLCGRHSSTKVHLYQVSYHQTVVPATPWSLGDEVAC